MDHALGGSWDRLVADAGQGDHIVQLYQDQDFLNRAVCRFAGAALANGEGVILVPTLTHWKGIRPRLEAEGVDVEAARERGQLTVVDADEFLPRFMRDAMPDSPVFLGLAADVIGQARAGGRYPQVRWWGEMVNVLWERGDVAASMNLEDLFDQLAKRHDIAIFCSFLMDNFNGEDRDDAAQARDESLSPYSSGGLRSARARRSRCAPGDGRPGRSPRPGESAALPLSAALQDAALQALLLALRQFLPTVADPVLQRSRDLYT